MARKLPDKETIKSMMQKGLSQNDIAKMYGVQQPAVSKVVHDRTSQSRKERKLPDKKVLQDLVDLKMSQEQIAEIYGVGQRSVSKMMAREGITPASRGGGGRGTQLCKTPAECRWGHRPNCPASRS